jgi:hypothetical protein
MDGYSKIVLTIIAISLSTFVLQNAGVLPSAQRPFWRIRARGHCGEWSEGADLQLGITRMDNGIVLVFKTGD